MWQQSRTGFQGQRERPRQKPGPTLDGHQNGPSGFVRLRTEGDIEDYHVQDGSSTLLVSFRPHVQPEVEDLADEGVEDERRSDREGER
jgi:hypothetical protein